MRTALVAVALVLVAACSGRAVPVIDGTIGDTRNVCEKFVDMFMACAANLNCSSFTDAIKKATCDAIKSATGTGIGTGTMPPCEGATKQQAERALASGLDELCMPRTP